jgi:hypothetical protein
VVAEGAVIGVPDQQWGESVKTSDDVKKLKAEAPAQGRPGQESDL